MKIEVFEKRNLPNIGYVCDDAPCAVYDDIAWVEINGTSNILFCTLKSGEELNIKMDRYNYKYLVFGDK